VWLYLYSKVGQPFARESDRFCQLVDYRV
jgi:hypothetical protein